MGQQVQGGGGLGQREGGKDFGSDTMLVFFDSAGTGGKAEGGIGLRGKLCGAQALKKFGNGLRNGQTAMEMEFKGMGIDGSAAGRRPGCGRHL